MKQIIAHFLAVSILLQAATPALWVLDYQVRRAVYLKKCENKNNPDLHCDGKCYLKKQVQANNQTDPKAPRLPENFYSIKYLNLFCENPAAFAVFPLNGSGLDKIYPPYQRYCPEAPAYRLFKPPAAA